MYQPEALRYWITAAAVVAVCYDTVSDGQRNSCVLLWQYVRTERTDQRKRKAVGLRQSGSLDCSVWPANRFRSPCNQQTKGKVCCSATVERLQAMWSSETKSIDGYPVLQQHSMMIMY
jgi:hypothetical protein